MTPDFRDIDVGIARTQPCDGSDDVREVEALFVDSIERAQSTIYVEKQFLSPRLIARRMARQLRHRPGLEIVFVAPRGHDFWIERQTKRTGRIRFWRTVRRAGGRRVRLLYPAVEQDGR